MFEGEKQMSLSIDEQEVHINASRDEDYSQLITRR